MLTRSEKRKEEKRNEKQKMGTGMTKGGDREISQEGWWNAREEGRLRRKETKEKGPARRGMKCTQKKEGSKEKRMEERSAGKGSCTS